MKKVLSVAMASAMVLGMGANAFAIQYSTGSSEKADWPKNFQFEGELFVTNKDGDIVKESTTRLNDSEAVDFEPGDVIWMPLYADNQIVYDSEYKPGTDDKDAVTTVKTKDVITVADSGWRAFQQPSGAWTWEDTSGTWQAAGAQPTGTILAKDGTKDASGKYEYYRAYTVTVPTATLTGTDYATRTPKAGSERYFIGATEYRNKAAFEQALADQGSPSGAFMTVDVEAVDGTDDVIGKPVNEGKVTAHGHYTGNIDKNWSINLIEKSTGVAELIEKAELYKATATDYHSYKDVTDEIVPNGVYLKITLEDEWKTTSEEVLKYYVYLAENKANRNKTTNEVWVSGTYSNTDVREVSFDWTNDASDAGLWKVKEGNGIAVFDFADKAFFSVKMYEGETMYLDLKTAYDKAIAGEMDAEADSFYKFDNTNANFARTGELLIVSDDSSLVPYQIDEDGNFVAVDAEYVENYAVAHTNKKVNGFVFNTKQLGNYVLSTEELGEEEVVAEEPTTEEPVVEEPAVEEPVVEETNKPNPNTGAEDFVGLAVSLAVVSVAAAGALALKK